MEGSNKPKRILTEHIQRGIAKYQGTKDDELNRFIANVGLGYVAYAFNDGRILLVLPSEMGALLYNSREDVYFILEPL